MKKTLLMMIAFMGIATIFSSCSKEEEEPPTADFTVSASQVSMGEEVNFSDNSEGEVTSYSWSFPGGSPETSSEKNPVVVYNAPGIYSATLTVSNDGGSTSKSKEDIVEVLAGPPTAAFSASASKVNAGEPVTFTDESTGNPTSWVWTISGAGIFEVISEQNATVTPVAPGMLTVSLYVTNEHGHDVKEIEDYVESYAPGLTIYNNAPSYVRVEYEGETVDIDPGDSKKIYDPNNDNSINYKVTTLAAYGMDLSSDWQNADLSTGDKSIEFDISYEYFFLKLKNNSYDAFDKIVVNAGLVSEVIVNTNISWTDSQRWIGYFSAYTNTVIEAHFEDSNSYIYWENINWSSLGSSNMVLDLVYDGTKSSIIPLKSNKVSKGYQKILLK